MTLDRIRNLQIRKKLWYIWIFRIVWIAWLALWAEFAIGSWKEIERRAFAISLVVFAVSFLLGIAFWLKRRSKSGHGSQS